MTTISVLAFAAMGGIFVQEPTDPDLSKSTYALYTSIAKGVDEARGRVLVKLRPGQYTAQLGDVAVRWKPTYNSQITAVFNYVKGGIGPGTSFEFKPPVEFTSSGPNSRPVFVRRAEFDKDGIPDLEFVDEHGAQAHPGLESASLIAAVLELDRKPASFFLGQPFKVKSTIEGGSGLASGAIQRIRFVEDLENDIPALAVKLKKGATINFSGAEDGVTTFKNSITLSATQPGGFSFKELDFYPLAGKADCELENLKVGIESGEFSVGKVDFDLRQGTELELKNIVADSDLRDHAPNLRLGGGNLNARIGNGSRMVINSFGEGFASDLRFGEGSEVKLNDFSLEVAEGELSKLECKGVSGVKLALREDSSLAINEHTKLVLRSGAAEIKLTAVRWETKDEQPVVKGQITDLSIDAKYAMMPVTVGGVEQPVEFDSAKLATTRLDFDSKWDGGMEGQLSDLSFGFRPGTRLVVAPHTVLQIGPSGSLVASDPNKPIRFTRNTDWPLGRYVIDLPTLTGGVIAPGAVATMESGSARFLQENVDGRRMISYAPGSLLAVFTIQATRGTLGLSMRSDAVHLDASDGDASLTGPFSASLRPGTGSTIVVNEHKQADRTWMFPVTLNVAVAVEVPLFNNRPLLIDREGIRTTDGSALTASVPLQLQIGVPKGVGEYKDPANLGAGGNDDDDEYRDKQEVLRYDAPDPLGVLHVYADQGTYSAKAQLDFSYIPGAPSPWRIRAYNFELQQQVKVTNDGLDALAAIADAVLFLWDLIIPGGDAPGSTSELVTRIANRKIREALPDSYEVGG